MLLAGADFTETKSNQAMKNNDQMRALMPSSKLLFETVIADKGCKNQLRKTCSTQHDCRKQTHLKGSASGIHKHSRNNSVNVNKYLRKRQERSVKN